MKNFNRILTFVVALVMIVATMSVTFISASAAEANAGTIYEFDLTLVRSDAEASKVVDPNGIWTLAGVSVADGSILPVRETLKDSGSGWLVGFVDDASQSANGYVVGCPEGSGKTALLDLCNFPAPRGTYNGAIIFTAPVDGTYTFKGEFSVISSLTNGVANSVYVLSGTEKTVIDTYVTTKENQNKTEGFVQEDTVELKAGDKIVFEVQRTENSDANGDRNRTSVRSVVVVLEELAPVAPPTADGVIAYVVAIVVSAGAFVVLKKNH